MNSRKELSDQENHESKATVHKAFTLSLKTHGKYRPPPSHRRGGAELVSKSLTDSPPFPSQLLSEEVSLPPRPLPVPPRGQRVSPFSCSQRHQTRRSWEQVCLPTARICPLLSSWDNEDHAPSHPHWETVSDPGYANDDSFQQLCADLKTRPAGISADA